MNDLAEKKCIPCEGGIPGFKIDEIHKYLKMVDGWEVKADESKIYYLIEHFERVKVDPMGMIFSGAGLVFLGGLIGGTLAVTYVLKKNKLQWFKFADIVAPLLILGYAIGRIGCLLVGDDYGKPTHLPWGISFPDGLPPSTYRIFQTYYPWVNLEGFDPGVLTVHPTQIYETILGLGIFYFLYKRNVW